MLPFLSAHGTCMGHQAVQQAPRGPPRTDVLSPELNSSRESCPFCSTSTQSKIISGSSSLPRKLNLATCKEGVCQVLFPLGKTPGHPQKMEGVCLQLPPLPFSPTLESHGQPEPEPALETPGPHLAQPSQQSLEPPPHLFLPPSYTNICLF